MASAQADGIIAKLPTRLRDNVIRMDAGGYVIGYIQPKNPLSAHDVDSLAPLFALDITIDTIVATIVDAECFKKLMRAIRLLKNGGLSIITLMASWPIDDECIELVIDEIRHNNDLRVLQVNVSDNLSEDALVRLFVTAGERATGDGKIEVLTIVNSFGPDLGAWRSFSDKVFQAYTDFILLPKKGNGEDVPMTKSQTKESLDLKRRMCTYMIKNKRATDDCLMKQRSILSAIVGVHDIDITALANELYQVASAEQLRLGTLTSDLVTSYAVDYGHCFISSLHLDEPTDQYVSSAAVRRFHDKPEALVNVMLGTAAWIENTFRSLLSTVVSTVNAASDMAILKDSFKAACVHEKVIRIANAPNESPDSHLASPMVDITGDFAPCGTMNGDFAFFNSSKRLYLYRIGPQYPAWTISEALGAVSTSSPWFFSQETGAVKSIVDLEPYTIDEFKDGYAKSFDPPIMVQVEFLSRVSYLHDQQLPAIEANVPRCEAIHGPPKSFERAAQKAKALDDKKFALETLKDLNRATITAHNAIALASAFHVLEAELTKIGGRFSKIKNKFDDADNKGRFLQPPNLHCFIKIPLKQDSHPSSKGGDLYNPNETPVPFWVCEVQFTYADILSVKKEQHFYYELERQAEDPSKLAIPVFKV